MKALIRALCEESLSDRWVPVTQRASKSHPTVAPAWEYECGEKTYRISQSPEDQKYHLDCYLGKEVRHMGVFDDPAHADAGVDRHV